MRGIKFRAWDHIDKNMIKVRKLEFLGSRIKINNDTNLVINTKTEENIKLMQYTGMKDVNENEIYEGDIVRVFERLAGEDLIGIVIYDESEGCYWIMQGNERNHCKVTFDLEDYSHYVIGNVYENAELLK